MPGTHIELGYKCTGYTVCSAHVFILFLIQLQALKRWCPLTDLNCSSNLVGVGQFLGLVPVTSILRVVLLHCKVLYDPI